MKAINRHADIDEAVAVVGKLNVDDNMRQSGYFGRIVGSREAKAGSTEVHSVAEGKQETSEERVQLEAVAATSTLGYLAKDVIDFQRDWLVEEDVQVLERNAFQMSSYECVEVFSARFRRLGQSQMLQVILCLLFRQRFHYGLVGVEPF